jgi:hypothetical protein
MFIIMGLRWSFCWKYMGSIKSDVYSYLMTVADPDGDGGLIQLHVPLPHHQIGQWRLTVVTAGLVVTKFTMAEAKIFAGNGKFGGAGQTRENQFRHEKNNPAPISAFKISEAQKPHRHQYCLILPNITYCCSILHCLILPNIA